MLVSRTQTVEHDFHRIRDFRFSHKLIAVDRHNPRPEGAQHFHKLRDPYSSLVFDIYAKCQGSKHQCEMGFNRIPFSVIESSLWISDRVVKKARRAIHPLYSA
jgi:hypothetical protein